MKFTINIHILFIIIAFSSNLFSQQNLVQNPNFEDTVSCPTAPSEVAKCFGWKAFRSTPEYMNSCSPLSSMVSVPYNFAGYQKAASGQGYCALATHVSGINEYREHIGGKLVSPLHINTKYYVSFKTVLGINPVNTFNCASNKLGAMFSTVQCDLFSPSRLTNNPPIYTDSIIRDTVNWVTISGSFIADSAYKYIILGNFFNEANTSIFQFATGLQKQAYYFIDNVCLSTDSIFTANWTDITKNFPSTKISLFPNPTKDLISIRLSNHNEINSVELITECGQSIPLNLESNTINITDFPDGFYFIKIRSDHNTYFEKIIVMH